MPESQGFRVSGFCTRVVTTRAQLTLQSYKGPVGGEMSRRRRTDSKTIICSICSGLFSVIFVSLFHGRLLTMNAGENSGNYTHQTKQEKTKTKQNKTNEGGSTFVFVGFTFTITEAYCHPLTVH